MRLRASTVMIVAMVMATVVSVVAYLLDGHSALLILGCALLVGSVAGLMSRQQLGAKGTAEGNSRQTH